MRARLVVLATASTLALGLLIAPGAAADEGAPAATAASTAPSTAPAGKLGARSVELLFAQGKGKARDMRGVMPSLYRGKWFVKRAEKKRRCIVRRESHGRYTAVSRGGLYRGAYQMNRGLAVGATYRMQREVRREMGPEAAARVAKLRRIPTQWWNRYWQDRAFWTIYRKGKGASHWRGGAWHC